MSQSLYSAPDRNCAICPRLKSFIDTQREKYPDWHNAPVPSFGGIDASFLIVGLAPGLRGANRTGRPFTGDWAGDLLYNTLKKFDFATGDYDKRPDDSLTLLDCRIANAVRCVPPENKPTGAEMKNCLPFLIDEIKAMPRLKAILCLGLISHNNVLKALGFKQSEAKFIHGAKHQLTDNIAVFDSYHCSRYNTNTGRLTTEMFESVFKDISTYVREET
ncbi:MAG: uracil-DNA glycosylase [Alphaproteobacteria bacterium]|nr:uracil-DNA glycosylase [Alphaproteobacteria bacterium]